MQDIIRSFLLIGSVIEALLFMGIGLIAIGVMVVLIGILVSILGGDGKQAESGAVVLIGPIPIVIADDARTAKILMILASFLMLVSLLVMMLMARV